MLIQKAKALLCDIQTILRDPHTKGRMPKNTFFMADGSVLCGERACGESRYPYGNDGYILWAHSTGHIHAKTGIFNVFKPIFDLSEPAVEFFATIEDKAGNGMTISLLGAAKQLYEPDDVERYVVYTPSAAYYLTDTAAAAFVVRASMSPRKETVFSVGMINKEDKPLTMRLTSYFNAFLKNGEFDNMWEVGCRGAIYHGEGSYELNRRQGMYAGLIINRTVTGAVPYDMEHTTSRPAFLGRFRGAISSAECLRTGKFADALGEGGGIAAEIMRLSVAADARVDFVLPMTTNEADVPSLLHQAIDPSALDAEVEAKERSEKTRLGNLSVTCEGFTEGAPDAFVFNNLIHTIQKQVDNCAMGKYYVEDLMGVRDVYQQLEQALLWDSQQAREKMLVALGFLDPSGRAPRQYSIPDFEGAIPRMDLRAFIDQGNWIISCFYSYLTWTNDFSILDEVVGYYENIEDRTVKKSELRDSALQHLIRIADYLERNLDTEDGTNCLRILHGDWNDALDGLGRTSEEGKRYGTGVSVMASLHFYQNLFEICEILRQVGGYEDKIAHYEAVRNTLKDALLTHAIQTNEQGKSRLIHGWGDHGSYRIGSFCDSDGKSRISFAPNAFWVTSGMIRETPELKGLIIDTMHALESRFGLLTLTPAFAPDAPGVGRLASILPGTAENECVYVHASMFSVMALFALGESEFAWREFYKVLPIAHEQMTRSPFVMSNSYLDNPAHGLNGQSAIDWYTGSGTLFIKILVRHVLGIQPDMGGIALRTACVMPCTHMEAALSIKGMAIRIIYRNDHNGQRRFYLDGQPLVGTLDEITNTPMAYLPITRLHNGAVVTVVD